MVHSLFVCLCLFLQLSNCCKCAVGIITASPANDNNGAGDYHGKKRTLRGEGGGRISLGDKRLHNLVLSSPLIHPLTLFYDPSLFFLLFPIFQHLFVYVSVHLPVFLLFLLLPPPLSPCNLPAPPPPSLFLVNLKFVRRLRLLDGWPLIFCELHLAQTSLRPWCILLTAALVAGPHHLS